MNLRNLAIWGVIIVVLIAVYSVMTNSAHGGPSHQVAYSELLARVEAHKAGHALHTQLVARLLADPSLWTITTAEAAVTEMELIGPSVSAAD